MTQKYLGDYYQHEMTHNATTNGNFVLQNAGGGGGKNRKDTGISMAAMPSAETARTLCQSFLDPTEVVAINLMALNAPMLKRAASLGNQSYDMQIPEMLFGFPSYDISKVSVYIRKQLLLLGYEVVYDRYSHKIIISWYF